MSSSSPPRSTRKIRLRSSDGKMFEVDEAIATQSETIKSMMEVIPVSDVTSKTLALIIDFCTMCLHYNHHLINGERDDHLRDWALHLFQADQSAFFDLVLAAHRLKITSLEDLTSQTMAEIIRGKSLEEIRQTFNLNTSSLSSSTKK